MPVDGTRYVYIDLYVFGRAFCLELIEAFDQLVF
jgi:hypothetical protein